MKSVYPRMVVGLGADGASFPVTPSGAAAAGEAVVGPLQLLAYLEVALGLGGRAPSVAKRIASWRAKLAAAGPGRFWAQSFDADPFATARTLLGWRDGLVESGWSPARLASAPKRLEDLAAAEASGDPVPAGYADRLCAVIDNLPGQRNVVGRIELIEPRALLPRGLARLIDALEANGAAIVELPVPLGQTHGDLGGIQAMMRGGEKATLSGDTSFAVLSATTELGAAEALADWLAIAPEAQGAVLIADRDTTALDAALQRRGLPPIGRSLKSPLRGILQVLPLAIAIRWAPFDALRMLEFLQLQKAPLPFAVRRNLIEALQGAPGRGGATWREAIAAGLAEDDARPAGSMDEATARAERARGQVAMLLDAPLLDPDAGMPLAVLRPLCGLVSTWAGQRGALDPLATRLAGAAKALSEAAATTGLDPIPRLDLERLLEQVMEEGLSDPGRTSAVAPWSVVHAPAGLWGSCDTLVWWGVSPPIRASRSPWTSEEVSALAGAGCPPDDLLAGIKASTLGWRHAILHARRKVLLAPAPVPGASVEAEHPLLQELGPVMAHAPAASRPVAEEILSSEDAVLLGARLPRTRLARLELPTSRMTWSIPAGADRQRARESASSLGQLLGCPYSWVAQYTARLQPGRQAALPQSEQMIGTLAHALVERVFPPGAPPEPDDAFAQATNILPDLIEEMAAPLLAPGQAAELMRVRRDLPEAARALATHLGENGLTIAAVEAEAIAPDTPSPGVEFGGRIDMQLTDGRGRPIVIDFKWSRNDRYRRQQLEKGSAVQLAAYARLSGAGEAAGYYMLAQRRIVGRAGAMPGGAIEGAPSLGDTWARVVESFNQRHAVIKGGKLHAIGIDYNPAKPAPDPDGISVVTSPHCNFCDYGHLCGKELVR